MWLRQFLVPFSVGYHRVVPSIDRQSTSTILFFIVKIHGLVFFSLVSIVLGPTQFITVYFDDKIFLRSPKLFGCEKKCIKRRFWKEFIRKLWQWNGRNEAKKNLLIHSVTIFIEATSFQRVNSYDRKKADLFGCTCPYFYEAIITHKQTASTSILIILCSYKI